ncbi:hypothetical protein MRX96_008109 [Rhipicephalus microplus]
MCRARIDAAALCRLHRKQRPRTLALPTISQYVFKCPFFLVRVEQRRVRSLGRRKSDGRGAVEQLSAGCNTDLKAMESGRPQVVSVGGSWLPAPRGFLLPLGTGITFGFGCAYLLLSVLSLDHPAVAPWLLARRKPNSFLSATGPPL